MAKFKFYSTPKEGDSWPVKDRTTGLITALFGKRREAREYVKSLKLGQGHLPGVWDGTGGGIGEVRPSNKILGPETFGA